jgi:hypothetical protein
MYRAHLQADVAYEDPFMYVRKRPGYFSTIFPVILSISKRSIFPVILSISKLERSHLSLFAPGATANPNPTSTAAAP